MDSQTTYNYKVVRQFTVMTVVWGIVGMLVGVLIGTYSSIYVASTALVILGVSKEDLLPPEKEGEGAEGQELP